MNEWDVLTKFYGLKSMQTPFFTADGTLRLDGPPRKAYAPWMPERPLRAPFSQASATACSRNRRMRPLRPEETHGKKHRFSSGRGLPARGLYDAGGKRRAAMQAQGQTLLDASMTERETAEITVPIAFFADAGEAVRLAPPGLWELGLFRVTESLCALGGNGVYTRRSCGGRTRRKRQCGVPETESKTGRAGGRASGCPTIGGAEVGVSAGGERRKYRSFRRGLYLAAAHGRDAAGYQDRGCGPARREPRAARRRTSSPERCGSPPPAALHFAKNDGTVEISGLFTDQRRTVWREVF
jgi:hypothetical protein